jgi:hypothetical protein
MQALVEGALRVLTGKEKPKNYWRYLYLFKQSFIDFAFFCEKSYGNLYICM